MNRTVRVMCSLAFTVLFTSSSSTTSAFLKSTPKNSFFQQPLKLIILRRFATTANPLVDIVRLRGTVDTGYGRGGKKLGFPTANLPSSLFQNALDQLPTGVYFGWALIEGSMSGRNIPHKAAVNIGYSPTFQGNENKEKIVEAHLIVNEPISDFYNEVMRLQLLGFLRPEKKFDSFPDLVQAISNDITNSNTCLDETPYATFQNDVFFTKASSVPWIGKDGGNQLASWEFEPFTL